MLINNIGVPTRISICPNVIINYMLCKNILKLLYKLRF